MLGVLWVALLSPQPSPSPLKTITHVRSSPLCTTLRENVGQAVKALIENNAAIGQSKSLFLKMARDKVSSVHGNLVMDLDVQRLGPLMDEIAQNLDNARTLLSDSRRFPTPPRTEDDRQLAEMQRELGAIVDRQNEALNILSGTYYSYNGNRLNGHGDGMAKHDGTGVPVDDPKRETPIVLPPIRSADALPAPNISEFQAASAKPPSVDLGLMGETSFAALFNSLTTYQINEQPLEAQAGKTILDVAAECR